MSSAPFASRPVVRSVGSAVRGLAPLLAVMVIGLFLARAPLVMGMFLLAGAVGGALLLRYPILGLYALTVAVPFGSLFTMRVGGFAISAAQLVLAASLVAWVAQSLVQRDLRVGRSRLTWAAVALAAVMGLSLYRVQALAPALAEWMKWIQFPILFVYVAGRVTWQQRRWLVLFLLVGGLLQGLLGIYQFFFRVGPPGFVLLGRYMRAHGTFGQPNPYGGYLGLLLPLAYAIVLTHWRAWLRPTTRLSLVERLLWPMAVVSTPVMLLALGMSWSRGALLGLVGGLGLVTLALARRAWPVLLTLALALLVSMPIWQPLLPDAYLARLDNLTAYMGRDLRRVMITDENFAIIQRLAHWDTAWQMFARYPWLGVGIGQYPVLHPELAIPRWREPLGHAHNYYLHTLAETGLLGLAAYLTLLVSALVMAWRRSQDAALWPRALALGALGMLGHLLAHSVVDSLYVQDIFLLIAMILGMLVTPLHNLAKSQAASLTRHTDQA